MARPKTFVESDVLDIATQIFADLGYNGTSIDDLLRATGLQRGSLYKAFGSKHGLFVRCLKLSLEADLGSKEVGLDLLIVALKDLAQKDALVREICLEAVCRAWDQNTVKPAEILGARIMSYLEEK